MTKTNPTTDGLVERLRELADDAAGMNVGIAMHNAYGAVDGPQLAADLKAILAALTASELLVTKLQNQLDSRGNSAVAESAPALHGATSTKGGV